MSTSPRKVSNRRLDGWKNITAYLGCNEKTARAWQQHHGLPIYRESAGFRSRVFAHSLELDAWKSSRVIRTGAAIDESPGTSPGDPLPPERAAGFRPWIAVLLVAGIALAAGATLLGRRIATPSPFRIGRVFAKATTEGAASQEFRVPLQSGVLVTTPDGHYVFLFELHKTAIHELDVSSGRLRVLNAGHQIQCLRVSPGGETLYAGTPEGIQVVERTTGATRFLPAGGTVSDIVVTDDGATLYAALGPRGLRRVDLRSHAVTAVPVSGAPHYLAIEPVANKLFLSYQNGGPGGRPGHDVVESLELATGKTVVSSPEVPLIGGHSAFSRATGRLWVNFWDACVTPEYDHAGCPSVPARGYQVFRASDLKAVQTVSWPAGQVEAAHMIGDGSRVIQTGDRTRVLDALSFRVLEELAEPSFRAGSPDDGRTLYLFEPGRVRKFDAMEESCAAPPSPAAQHFGFDGTLADSVESTAFTASGPVSFVPGKLGQAVRLGREAEIRMSSPSAFRLGNPLPLETSLSFWFRAAGPGQLLGRESNIPWSIRWSDGKVTLAVNGDLSIAATATAAQWHHLAVSRNGDNYALFLDGALAGTAASRRPPGPGVSGDFVSFGDHDLDELTTFGRALSEADWKQMAAWPVRACTL